MLLQTVGCHGPSLPGIDLNAVHVLAISLPSPEHVERRRERSLFILLDGDNAIGSGAPFVSRPRRFEVVWCAFQPGLTSELLKTRICVIQNCALPVPKRQQAVSVVPTASGWPLAGANPGGKRSQFDRHENCFHRKRRLDETMCDAMSHGLSIPVERRSFLSASAG